MAVLALTAVSCSKPEGEVEHTLALANEIDSEIILNSDMSDAIEVVLKTDIASEKISVSSSEDWCAASIVAVEESVIVKILPGENETKDDRTAVITITAEGVAEAVTIKVIKRGSDTELTTSVECEDAANSEVEYGILKYNAAPEGGSVAFKVSTNAARWYALSMMGELAGDWFEVSPLSGRNGEICEVTFKANTGTSIRNLNFFFDSDPEAYFGSAMVTILQNPVPAKTCTFKAYDSDTEVVGGVLSSVDLTSSDNYFEFCPESDGGIDLKICAAGAATEFPGAENSIILSKDDIYDASWSVVGSFYSVECKLKENADFDVVAFAAGSTTELARIKCHFVAMK